MELVAVSRQEQDVVEEGQEKSKWLLYMVKTPKFLWTQQI